MTQRILTLYRYLLTGQIFSLSGVIYTIAAFSFYALAFQQRTPEIDYFILVIAVFGGTASLLTTLTISTRAYLAASSPFFARLPNRVEYLMAVFLAALTYVTALELFIAALALLRNGPAIDLTSMAVIPPIWLAINILMITLALHATDLVTKDWSRTYIFSILALFLISQTPSPPLFDWFLALIRQLSDWFRRQDMMGVYQLLQTTADKIGSHIIGDTLGHLFWPFRALADGTIAGTYTRTQALAPALLILYATLLFLLAADFLATKDLHLLED